MNVSSQSRHFLLIYKLICSENLRIYDFWTGRLVRESPLCLEVLHLIPFKNSSRISIREFSPGEISKISLAVPPWISPEVIQGSLHKFLHRFFQKNSEVPPGYQSQVTTGVPSGIHTGFFSIASPRIPSGIPSGIPLIITSRAPSVLSIEVPLFSKRYYQVLLYLFCRN